MLSVTAIADAPVNLWPGKFWHCLDAVNCSRYSVSSRTVLILNPLYCGVTAYPFRCVTCDLFGQDHHYVHRSAFADLRRTFKKDAGLTEVQSFCRNGSVIGVHLGRNLQTLARRNSLFFSCATSRHFCAPGVSDWKQFAIA